MSTLIQLAYNSDLHAWGLSALILLCIVIDNGLVDVSLISSKRDTSSGISRGGPSRPVREVAAKLLALGWEVVGMALCEGLLVKVKVIFPALRLSRDQAIL